MDSDRDKTPTRRQLAAKSQRRSMGFTFVEVMVTLAVAAVLVRMAAPSFSEMIAKQRIKTVAGDLYISLTKARSEALKRNTSVKLSPVGGQWQSGWSIANPSDATQKLDDHGAAANITIVGPTDLTYRSSGRVLGSSAPTFDISATGTSTHYCVTVDLTGRPYQKTSSC